MAITESVSAEEVATTEKVEQVAYYDRKRMKEGTIPADDNKHEFVIDPDKAIRMADSQS